MDSIQRRLFCDVCVRRNWHRETPPLTPPASPTLESRDAATVERSMTEHTSLPPTGQAAERRALPSHRPSHLRDTQKEAAPPSTIIGNQLNNGIAPSAHNGSSSSEFQQNSPRQMQLRGSRRSRYTTLPDNVDSALKVLYVELETAAELRQKVAALEAQVSLLQRQLQLQHKETALARKAADMAPRVSQEELERLRSEASEGRAAVEGSSVLRSQNQALEVELKECKSQLGKLTDTLQEWKQKLSGLVGD